MGRLANKRCVVTGGASGLGLGIATRFMEEGASVLITDINEAAGADEAKRIGAAFAPQDVSNEKRWDEVMALAESRLGGVDVLVNNAGLGIVGEKDTLETVSLADWRRLFSINVDGVFMGCRAALGPMRRAGGGSIINMSSVASLVVTPFIIGYGAGKAAVEHLSRSVALHCAQRGDKIRCNSIHPGQIKTPMHDSLVEGTAKNAGISEADSRAGYLKMIPIGEFGTPLDIANAALYLASDESRHVTGTRMVVDGGMQLIG